MFNPTALVIDAFVELLADSYRRVYGVLDAEYANVIGFVGRVALENIANSDAAYHDVNHTIMVTQVGQEILRGRHLKDGGVTTRDWLHFVISLLCHDVGYVRGVCRNDTWDGYVRNAEGDKVALPPGATDAALTPYHVERSKLFVRERFGKVKIIDAAVIEENIQSTRFPVPAGENTGNSSAYPGLLRAADLIGQLADIGYERKQTALFHEFQETGTAAQLGYRTPEDLRRNYPKFFWKAVAPYINDALRYLSVTQEGKQWIANLYAHVFVQEHGAHGLGPLGELGDPAAAANPDRDRR
jgi:hypothetical protein